MKIRGKQTETTNPLFSASYMFGVIKRALAAHALITWPRKNLLGLTSYEQIPDAGALSEVQLWPTRDTPVVPSLTIFLKFENLIRGKQK